MDVGYGIQAAVNEGQDEHNALLQDVFFFLQVKIKRPMLMSMMLTCMLHI